MKDSLTRLESWAAPLLAQLDTPARRRLAREIGIELRRSQRQRIADQLNPDGSQFAPRKAQEKRGRIRRRAMFMKLRQSRYLQLHSDASSVAVGFTARIARIARVHQYGLRDRVRRGGPEVRYESRELLGFSNADLEMIMDKLTAHITLD